MTAAHERREEPDVVAIELARRLNEKADELERIAAEAWLRVPDPARDDADDDA